MNREQKEYRKKNPIKAKLQDTINIGIGQICKLYREGKTEKEISSITKFPLYVVENVIHDLGLIKRYSK